VEERRNALCLHPDSTPNVDQGSELSPRSQLAHEVEGLAQVLKQSLLLAVEAQQWGLVAALAKQLDAIRRGSADAFVVLRGGTRARR